MLVQGKRRPTYLFSSNLQIWLRHPCLGYASNMRVFQASKLVDEVELRETLSPSSEKLYYSSKSQSDDDSDADTNHTPIPINKAIEGVEELCKACIKNKHAKIIKSKKMTLTIRCLQKIHGNL